MKWFIDTTQSFSVTLLKSLYIVLLMLVVCACKSSRNLETNVDAISQEEIGRLMQSMDSLQSNVQLLRKESSEYWKNQKIESKTTYWSAPDSTGKQYPTLTNETKTESNEQETSHTDTELYASVSILSAKIDSLSARFDAVLNTKEKVIELSWWDRHKDKIYISLFLVALVWVVWKTMKK